MGRSTDPIDPMMRATCAPAAERLFVVSRPRCQALVGCHSMRAGTDQGLFRRSLVFLERLVSKA
jgi:hypothetical protein